MIEQINLLLQEVKNLSAGNAEELEALRLKYLSKKVSLTALCHNSAKSPQNKSARLVCV